MKIWFIAAVSKESRGGISRSIEELSLHLENLGHKVEVIQSNSSLLQNYLLFAIYAVVKLALARHHPDWIIARSTDGVFCSILKKIFRLEFKVALHNHGWEEKVYEEELRLPSSIINNRTTWKSLFIRFPLLRLSLKFADVVICGTVDEARWIRRKYMSCISKLTLVPNGVDAQAVPLWINKQISPNFLFVGGPTWKKNAGYAIKVFIEIKKLIKNASLTIVGFNHSKDDTVNSIYFRTSVESDSMCSYYQSSPYLLSTSRYEGGHSFAILEAMSYGAVVCVSPILSSKEIVKHKINGLVISGIDPIEDADLLFRAIQNETLIRSIRAQAWKTACRNRWERQALRLSKILECENY